MPARPKKSSFALAAFVVAGILAGCNSEEKPAGSGEPRKPGAGAPQPPSEEVRSALEAQEAGRKFLGKTALMINGQFVKADFQTAPEYYLIHYSASW